MEHTAFKKRTLFVCAFALFALLAIARIFIFLRGDMGNEPLFWAMTYNVMALFGGGAGLYLSRHWGGYKSVLGRASLAFALGLFAQAFGQNVYNYFYLTQGFGITVPYPSIGDIGYFGSVLLYAYGALLLAKLAGAQVSLRSFGTKIQAFLIPLALLVGSYFIFLRGYTFDWSNPVKVFLDFGYPLGQAFYVSIALLTLLLSRKFLGGMLRAPIYFFVIALIVQYFCDFVFLYQANNGTFVAGGINDCMYLVSYFIMTLSLIKLGSTFDKIQSAA